MYVFCALRYQWTVECCCHAYFSLKLLYVGPDTLKSVFGFALGGFHSSMPFQSPSQQCQCTDNKSTVSYVDMVSACLCEGVLKIHGLFCWIAL